MALEVKSCLHYSVVDFARIVRNDPTFGPHLTGISMPHFPLLHLPFPVVPFGSYCVMLVKKSNGFLTLNRLSYAHASISFNTMGIFQLSGCMKGLLRRSPFGFSIPNAYLCPLFQSPFWHLINHRFGYVELLNSEIYGLVFSHPESA